MLPHPEPGLVISYGYLWRYEHKAGFSEERKSRPCVVVLAVENLEQSIIVTVAPVTHVEPSGQTAGIEIPQKVKQHLGLDSEKSWVVVSECNKFVWPGYDLRHVPGNVNKFYYGFLPPNLFDKIRAGVIDAAVAGGLEVLRD